VYSKREIKGINIKLPSDLGFHSYLAGYHCVTRASKDISCYLDIGANVGYYVIVASKSMKPDGNIYAFEAIKENVDVMKDNLNKYSLTQKVVIENRAVSNSNKPLVFYLTDNPSKHTALKHKSKTFSNSKRKVDTLILDDYMKEKVDFIKLDVEGWECLCLESAQRIISLHKPHIMFEFTPKRINKVKSVKWLRKFLMKYYSIFYEIDDRGNSIFKIDPKSLTDDYFKKRGRSNSDIFCTNSIDDLEQYFSLQK